MSAALFCGGQQRAVDRRAGSFEPATVRLLETWYAANVRHPYPDDVTLAALATGGGISVKQARKWLANRRVRTCNTLTYNGSVHPRRLRRLRRQMADRDDADEAQPPRQPFHSTPVQTAPACPSSTPGVPATSAVGSSFLHDGSSAFRTSTPLPGAFGRRGGRVELDSAAVRGVRHHPYLAVDRVASSGRGEARMITPLAGCFAAAAAAPGANFASFRQMATAQLNIFNVFNSA